MSNENEIPTLEKLELLEREYKKNVAEAADLYERLLTLGDFKSADKAERSLRDSEKELQRVRELREAAKILGVN